MGNRYLVTGGAGFIGYHLSLELLRQGHQVFSVDSLNDYYDPAIKRERVGLLEGEWGNRYRFVHVDVAALKSSDLDHLDGIFHLAARAGVRHSTAHPFLYLNQNVGQTMHLFELAKGRHIPIVYASSSSAKNIASIYGATKRMVEDLADAYASLYGMSMTGLRYHTVYGPWGRPDMAMWGFVRNIMAGDPVTLYNDGNMSRDFTFVTDIVAGTIAAMKRCPPGLSRVYDLGAGRSVALRELIEIISLACGKQARIEYGPMQTGDVKTSLANLYESREELGYEPCVDVIHGVPRFVEWMRGRM